jgi:uncharacterized protein (UPF0335 family)
MSNNQISSIVQRIERLEDEKSQIAEDIKEVYKEAKGNGFDPKIIKKVVSLRKMDAAKRLEEQQLIATYMDALGMLADTPLGRAAIKSVSSKSDEEDFA